MTGRVRRKPFDVVHNTYGPEVLIGQWAAERCSKETDPKAIIPGTYGKSRCLEGDSSYRLHFKNLSSDAHKDFLDLKLEGFGNRLNSNATHIKFSDGLETNNIGTHYSYGNCTRTILLRKYICEKFEQKKDVTGFSLYQQDFKRLQIKPDPRRRRKPSLRSNTLY